MNYETFRGRDVAEALAQVRAAFGENALIGSTKVVSNGRLGALGHAVVEVTAAPGAPPPRSPFSQDLLRRSQPQSSERRLPATPGSSPSPRAFGSAPVREPDGAARVEAALSAEIRSLRALVEEMAQTRKPKDRAVALLHAAGIEGPLASALADGSARAARGGTDALVAWLKKRLAANLSTIASPLTSRGPRVVACVGPTGVGKTTTLAKLAARAHIELAQSVSIITLDTFRVGAVEQMRRFAELIGVRFDVAQDTASFAQVLAASREEVVLVDTPSRSPSDTMALRRLVDCLRATGPRASHVLLTVPASLRARDLERIAGAYETCSPTGVVVTKLDETDQIGGSVHAALRGPWPLAFLCDGPRVPEDIHDANVDEFVERVFSHR
jgi:flagellar biosynthesis protein FlhF